MVHGRSGLSFDRFGSGPALVLLPGLGSRRQVWTPVVKALAASMTVYAVDLPGFGDSPVLPGVSSMQTIGDAIVEFIDEQHLGCPHVAGNSLGGALALELARRGSVASVTALSPIGFWSTAESRYASGSLKVSRMLTRRAGPVLSRVVARPVGRRLLLAQTFARPERLAAATARAEIKAFASAPAFDRVLAEARKYRFDRGHELDVPVTIAWGEVDRLLLLRQADRARRRLPQARHVRLAGCGHVPMSDDPALVARILLEAGSIAYARACCTSST